MSNPDRPESSSPRAKASLMERFRAEKKSLPLHGQEKMLLVLFAIHLAFLPWALATMHPWSQITSLVVSTITFLCALLPRNYTADHTGGPAFRLYPGSKLIRFPIFWIGLVFLGYVLTQGLNPSWVWERNEKFWWMRKVTDIGWLPTSADTPFAKFNLWRQFIIYVSGFFVVCSVWIGLSRRRSLELLFWIIAGNGVLVALGGLAVRLWRNDPGYVLFFTRQWFGASSFAGFIYRNHAGAYLCIALATVMVLALVKYQQDKSRMARSTAAVPIGLAIIPIGIAIVTSYSRGATLIAGFFMICATGIVLIYRLTSSSKSTTPFALKAAVFIVVAGISLTALSKLDYQIISSRLEELFEKPDKDYSVNSRLMAHAAAKDMLSEHWERGVGAGAFRYFYPKYLRKYPAIYQGGQVIWEHAHSDWLEIPIELGAAGIGILTLGALWVGFRLLRDRVWRHLPLLLLVVGLGQTLAHATFDFPFQCPAILFTWLASLFGILRWLELERVQS